MTCGAPECQRQQHSEACRAWRTANAEVSRWHYQDVVVPFRQQQPDYQRRWRLARRLVEIREQTTPVVTMLLWGLGALLMRVQKLCDSPTRARQTGVVAGEKLDKAGGVLRAIIAAIEQLQASVSELGALGLEGGR